MRRPALVVIAAAALIGIGGPALASWAAAGTGSGQVSAGRLNAATGLGTSAGIPSHTAISVNFTPGSNPAGTTYVVTRDKKKDGTAGPEVACSGLTASPCSDTSLTAATTYTYTVKAVLSAWSEPTVGSTSRTTANTPVVADTTAPVVTVSCAFGSGSNYSCGGSYGILPGDLSTLTLTIRSTETGTPVVVGPLTTMTTQAAGTWSYASSNLSKGSYTATISQNDSAGNTGSATSATFTRS